jgi:Ni/Fe-hydrogenase subunit HybB-like protein
MNVSITGMEGWAQVGYFPSWMEIAVTMMIVAIGFAGFGVAARYLPVFPQGEEKEPAAVEETAHVLWAK